MPDAKHVNKSIKQEDGKGESAGPAVSNIPAEALNRLIAMGGPPGEHLFSPPLMLLAILPQRCQYIYAAIHMSVLCHTCVELGDKLLAKTGEGLVCDILLCTRVVSTSRVPSLEGKTLSQTVAADLL